MAPEDELVARVQLYSARNQLELQEQLGRGVHGIVFIVQSQSKRGRSAVKVHEREPAYSRERDVYLRLQEHGVKLVCGCHVPQLVGYDDELRVINMTVVRPLRPQLRRRYLDESPEFSEEVMAEWRAEKQEQFEQRWPEVQGVLAALEMYGVFMLDVNRQHLLRRLRRFQFRAPRPTPGCTVSDHVAGLRLSNWGSATTQITLVGVGSPRLLFFRRRRRS